MAGHPQLKTFIVCLPIDLRDNRSGRKLSEVQLYENWRDKSIKAALAQGRSLEIELWSASSITERLGRDTPAYSGRARYWFDTVSFCSAWSPTSSRSSAVRASATAPTTTLTCLSGKPCVHTRTRPGTTERAKCLGCGNNDRLTERPAARRWKA